MNSSHIAITSAMIHRIVIMYICLQSHLHLLYVDFNHQILCEMIISKLKPELNHHPPLYATGIATVMAAERKLVGEHNQAGHQARTTAQCHLLSNEV